MTKSKNTETNNGSLMRKTKAQLVEIILRKDNIEKSLRNDINGTNNVLEASKKSIYELSAEVDNLTSKNNILVKDNETLKSDYESTCDNYVTELVELKNKWFKTKTYISISIFVNIIFIIKMILGLIF